MDATHEEWHPVVGHEGAYEVSSLGRVRSLDRIVSYKDGRTRFAKGQILRQTLNRRHLRYMVSLGFGGQCQVHPLVATAFHGPRPPGMECCHIDGNPTNNKASNLRWDTPSGNGRDKRRHGTDHNVNKTHCPHGHLYDAMNTYVRPGRASRNCRTCKRENTRRARANGVKW